MELHLEKVVPVIPFVIELEHYPDLDSEKDRGQAALPLSGRPEVIPEDWPVRRH